MRYMTVNELREAYLQFFESKGHLRIPSASLVPKNDPSILLINAGMTPMKAYFTGAAIPPAKRVTNSQKCVRTGDLENIGYTARHVSFFEMLGNFSFGDYFKKEMIPWIWEFCTQVLGMEEDKLYPTVYELDDESYDIWTKTVGVPEERVYRLGKADNFWEHGVGPSGPCTEILYDRGEKYSCGKDTCAPGCDCDRYMEFWNSVFSQFERQEDGTYIELKQKNIDTGVGLERLATIVQDVDSIYEIDTVKSILGKVCEISGKTYGEDEKTDISLRIITDHARSATMMVSDGITPSNNGRGYVLRNLIRRAVRQASLLGVEDNFLSKVVEEVVAQSKDAYPELESNLKFILYTIDSEETTFRGTLNSGNKILDGYIKDAIDNKLEALPAEDVFKLHDTYGFPLDLTKEIAKESGLEIDEQGFRDLMEEQRMRAQANTKKNVQSAWAGDKMPKEIAQIEPTNFTGYETLVDEGKILYLLVEDGDKYKIVDSVETGTDVVIITDKTPFFGTGGGQIGDKGFASQGDTEVEITMTNKNRDKVYFHQTKVLEGTLYADRSIKLEVDRENRRSTARNHTATHLLHKALRKVIGEHVIQAGSEFNGEYFRFDFTHQGGLSADQLAAVEAEVNWAILEDMDVEVLWEPVEEAKAKGAIALFDETYAEIMRTIYIGEDYSIELCGGTHLKHTSQVGSFRILTESSVAAGIRRIEAATGFNALRYYNSDRELLASLSDKLNTSVSELDVRLDHIIDKNKELEKEVKTLENAKMESANKDLLSDSEDIAGINLLVTEVSTDSVEQMRELGDKFMAELEPAVVILGRKEAEKVNFLVMSSDQAIDKGVKAGDIVKVAAKVAGGGGGGKANMAQAGGKDSGKLEEALESAKTAVKEILA